MPFSVGYLTDVKVNGAAKTHADRSDTLFDFCFGRPPEYRNRFDMPEFRDKDKDGGAKKLSSDQRKKFGSKKIHCGYGGMRVSEIRKHHSDCCMYSCRHTYAKKILEGYWSGRPTNIETLARMMGNTPQVCRDHYLNWSKIDNDPIWEVAKFTSVQRPPVVETFGDCPCDVNERQCDNEISWNGRSTGDVIEQLLNYEIGELRTEEQFGRELLSQR